MPTTHDIDRRPAPPAPAVPPDSPLAEFLAELPGWASRGLVYLILALVIALLGWAAFSRVAVTVAVPATVVPQGHLKHVQTPFAGMVRRIHVAEGDSVAPGDLLLEYESTVVSDMLTQLAAAQAELDLALEHQAQQVPRQVEALEQRLAGEREAFARRGEMHAQSLDKLAERGARLRLEMRNTQSRLGLVESELAAKRTLSEQGVVPEFEILQLRRTREQTELEVGQIRSALRDVENDEAIERQQFGADRARHAARVGGLRQQIEDLRAAAQERVAQARIERRRIGERVRLNLGERAGIRGPDGQDSYLAALVAPVSGVVAEMAVRHAGEALQPGRSVVAIVPSDVPLVAELMIPDRDIGSLTTGLPVRYKLAAFPFAEHGVLTGELSEIRPSASGAEAGGQPVYVSSATLAQDYFRVDGRRVPLMPGMTATAEISTGRRSVLSLLLRPFAQLGEPERAEP